MIRICTLECKRRHCFQFTAHVHAYTMVSFCSIAWLKSPQNGECNISIISYFWEINGNYTSLIFHTQRLQVCKITPKTNMIFPWNFDAGFSVRLVWVFQSWRSLKILGENPTGPFLHHAWVPHPRHPYSGATCASEAEISGPWDSKSSRGSRVGKFHGTNLS